MATVEQIRVLLHEAAQPDRAVGFQKFFKTGPGQYGEGDLFLGITVPEVRKVVRQAGGLNLDEATELLHSKWHEERLLAVLILVQQFERGDEEQKAAVFERYLQEKVWINNWDLVDSSAPNIVGAWLLGHPDKRLLLKLARSVNIWERRIAILATYTFIRARKFEDTLELTELLLQDRHDLMHKACGWMLREVGKRDQSVLEQFLFKHAAIMPRTMLRYAIERFSPEQRSYWLGRKRESEIGNLVQQL